MTGIDHPRRLRRVLVNLVEELSKYGRSAKPERPPKMDTINEHYSQSVELSNELKIGSSWLVDPTTSLVTTRRTDAGFIVVADFPQTAEIDYLTDLDREVGILTLGLGGEVIARVPLPDNEWTIADITVKNGVLEVTLVPDT